MSILDLFGRKVSPDEPGIVDLNGRKVTLGGRTEENVDGTEPVPPGKKARCLSVTGFRLIALCSDRHMRDMGITPELAADLMAVVKKHRPKLEPVPLMVVQVVKKRRPIGDNGPAPENRPPPPPAPPRPAIT